MLFRGGRATTIGGDNFLAFLRPEVAQIYHEISFLTQFRRYGHLYWAD